MKNKNEIRDDNATAFEYCSGPVGFKEGFDFRDAMDNEALKLAVEALEYYGNRMGSGETARAAIAEIRKIQGME